jgi:formylmethanofuran dehydrogenase subunit B
VTCPGCGCVCDDLAVTVADQRVIATENACALGTAWFHSQADGERLPVQIDGQAADFRSGIARAAEVLRNSQWPLVCGLSRSATPGQRAAVALAESIGAVIDTTASMCHGPSIMALQEVGEVTCTLGEVRNRADLVIFWGCDPATTHPRHAERYSVFPTGTFRPRGRANRTVVMVGDADEVGQWRLDPQGSLPDLVVPIERGRSFETLLLLRQLVFDEWRGEAPTALRQLADAVTRSQWGIVFFGLGLVGTEMWTGHAAGEAGNVNVQALLSLVAELNQDRRFFARRMRLQGGVSGADNVLSWQTGFPFAVDLSRGYPRYNPGEFTASALLEHQEVDACVLVGAEMVGILSPPARAYLESIPTIVIDYAGSPAPFSPTVSFTTAAYGLHAPGTLYRMDNVPILAQQLLSSALPTDEAVLSAIRRRHEAQGDRSAEQMTTRTDNGASP